jgi:biopolymer transport protein TolR
MARRNFARPHRLHALNELNVTPLLDLCFCLLIIFMIATPVMEQTARVDLPDAASKPSGPAGPKPKAVFVSFTSTGLLTLGDSPATIGEIRAKFKEIAALDKDAQPVVRIRGDRKGAFDTYAQILDAFTDARLTKLGVDYSQK